MAIIPTTVANKVDPMNTQKRISRGFHRLGIFLAAMVPAIYLAVLTGVFVNALVGAEPTGTLAFVLGLIGLGLFIYGVVRAIGWVIGGFAA